MKFSESLGEAKILAASLDDMPGMLEEYKYYYLESSSWWDSDSNMNVLESCHRLYPSDLICAFETACIRVKGVVIKPFNFDGMVSYTDDGGKDSQQVRSMRIAKFMKKFWYWAIDASLINSLVQSDREAMERVVSKASENRLNTRVIGSTNLAEKMRVNRLHASEPQMTAYRITLDNLFDGDVEKGLRFETYLLESMNGRLTDEHYRLWVTEFVPLNVQKSFRAYWDRVVDAFINVTTQAFQKPAFSVEFHKGEDVQQALRSFCGTQLGSCMTGKNEHVLWIYMHNPSRVRLLEVRNQAGRPVARALLWLTDEKKIFLDRIYPNHETSYAFYYLRDLAERKGWVFRPHQGYPDSDYRSVNDLKKMRVTLDVAPDDFGLPYMDTFCFFDVIGDGRVVMSNYEDDMQYTALETDGSHTYSDERSICDCCDRRRDNDEMNYVEGWGDVCEGCLEDNFVWVEGLDRYVHGSDAVYDDYACEYIHQDDAVYLANGSHCYSGNAISVDGEWYYEDDVIEDYDGEHIVEETAVLITQGEFSGEYASPNDRSLVEWKGERFMKTDLELMERMLFDQIESTQAAQVSSVVA